jgi:hypothetical protein
MPANTVQKILLSRLPELLCRVCLTAVTHNKSMHHTCDSLAVVGTCIIKLPVIRQLEVSVKYLGLHTVVRSIHATVLPSSIPQVSCVGCSLHFLHTRFAHCVSVTVYSTNI